MNHLDLSYLILPVTPVILLAVSTSIIFPFFLPSSTISLVSPVPFLPVLIFLVTLNCMHYCSQLHPKRILQSTYIQSPYTKVFTHTSSIVYVKFMIKNTFSMFLYSSQAKGSWMMRAVIYFGAVVSSKRNQKDE